MLIPEIIFWTILATLFHTYFGYAILMQIWNAFRPPVLTKPDTFSSPQELPPVTHIIAAYNEEQVISAKLANCRALEYPSHLIRTIVVADGSTDETVSVVRQYEEVKLLYQPLREGKAPAINRAVAFAGGDGILLFSDANSMLNPGSVMQMVEHYRDPRIGGVAGEKRVMPGELLAGKAESLYWRYESGLKKLEARFHTVVGAAGELFSIRADLFSPLPRQVILDDLYLSLDICRKDWLVAYEPSAYSMEYPSATLGEEMERKVRISAGAFQGMAWTIDLLSFTKNGRLAFQYLSHRVLRLAVCPFILPLLFAINAWLAYRQPGSVYDLLFILQLSFYALAFLGAMLVQTRAGKWKLIYVPFYFLFMNFSVWLGLARYLKGTQSAAWEKASRNIVR